MGMLDSATRLLQRLTSKDAPAPVPDEGDRGPELAFGGAKITAGIIQDEHVAELQGNRGIQAATKMRRSDAQVRAVEKVISLPLRSTVWLVEEPDKAGSAEKEATELLRANLMGGMETSWDDLLREATLAIYYGFRVPEIVWEEREGRIDVARIAPRNPELLERWLYTPEGRLAGYLYTGNRPLGEGVKDSSFGNVRYERIPIPLEKTLHFVYDGENDNPQGFGLWRSMYGPQFIKTAIIKVVAVGIERNLLDVPVGKLGAGAQKDDKLKMLSLLARWRAAKDAAVVLEDGQSLEFVGSQRSLMDAMPFLHFQNTQIGMAGLCQFLNLGSQGVGTQALATEHVKIFELAEDANARWIEQTIQQQLIRRWCHLNYGPALKCPVLKHKPIRARDLAAWSQALTSLVTGGLLHATVDDEQHIRDMMELPEISREQLASLEQARLQAEQEKHKAEMARLSGGPEKTTLPASRKASEPGCGHQFAEGDDEAARAERRGQEQDFTTRATELLAGIQESYLAALRPLVEEAQDAERIAQGKPIDRLPDVAVPGIRRYTEFVRSWLWDVLNEGRSALERETGQKASEKPVSNRLRQWISARAEITAQSHLNQLAEMSPSEIFSEAGSAAVEEFNSHVQNGWHEAAAELLDLMHGEAS